MEALISRSCFLVAALSALGAGYPVPQGSYRTRNFIVQASSSQFAKQVGDEAERFRRELAISWLGRELPPWPQPCPIQVQDAPHLGAGGATEYTPTPQGVRDFRMSIQGSRMRIMDSVLPHEVTHTILATHFRQPLPRWADEGACTTVEHSSEKNRHEEMLREFLTHNRGIAMNRLFLMRDYPSDILPLYAQGYSVVSFLIEQGGRRKFIEFVGEVLEGSQWTDAVRRRYGYDSLAELQELWLNWVADGSGPVNAYVSNAAQSDIAQVSAVSDSSRSSVENTQGSLASSGKGSWYLRRRQQKAAEESALRPEKQSREDEKLGGLSSMQPRTLQIPQNETIPWGPQQGTVWR